MIVLPLLAFSLAYTAFRTYLIELGWVNSFLLFSRVGHHVAH